MEIPKIYLSKEDTVSGGGYLKQFSVSETFQLHTLHIAVMASLAALYTAMTRIPYIMHITLP